MTNFKILRALEAAGYLETLHASELINKHILVRYRRYTYYLELSNAHPEEKHANIVMDASIYLEVSIQTIYEDIRVMEREIQA